MDHITIRSARPEDARSIAKLHVETWRATYAGMLSAPYLVGLSAPRQELGWRNVILREPRDVRVAVGQGDAILGFGSCGPNRGALFRRLVAAGRSSAIVWVLRDNPSRFFYERLGGRQVTYKTLAFAGSAVEAVAYGWGDLPGFLATASSEDRESEP